MSRRVQVQLMALQPDEVERLLNACSDELRTIVLMALNTGMCESELLILKWADVNLEKKTIRVSKSATALTRVIPMNRILCKEFKKLDSDRCGDFVFSTATGDPHKEVSWALRATCEKAGLPDFGFDNLQCTFASNLVMSGTDIRTIQNLMGHKTIRMTTRYADISKEYLRDAIKRQSSEQE